MNTNKISVGLLIALVGFPQISETIYTPALPSVVQGLGTTPYLVEITLSIYFLGFAFGVMSWGTISDYRGRRFAMLAGLVLYGVGTIACGLSASIEALLAWRLVQAFGASVGSVITQTILRDTFSGMERTKLFSVMSGALAFSPAIGPLLGGFISEYFGWRANFWALGALAVILIIWAWYSLPETRPERINKKPRVFISMMCSRQLWGHILLIGATNGIIFGFYQEAPFMFIDQMGMPPVQYGCFGLLIACATIFASRMAYKGVPIYVGVISVLIGGILFFWITIPALFLVFFGVGLIIPSSLSQALKPYQEAIGTAGSIFGGTYYLLIAGFTWLMGAMHDGSALALPSYITLLSLVILVGYLGLTTTDTPADSVPRKSTDAT